MAVEQENREKPTKKTYRSMVTVSSATSWMRTELDLFHVDFDKDTYASLPSGICAFALQSKKSKTSEKEDVSPSPDEERNIHKHRHEDDSW